MSFPIWDYCSGGDQAKGKDDGCSVNFKYGMKRDFNLVACESGLFSAFKIADSAQGMESRFTPGQEPSSFGQSRAWKSQTKWIWRKIALATKQT